MNETTTPNLGLIKPGLDDNYDITKINSNSDTLDTTIKALQDAVATINSTLATIQSALETLQTNVTGNSSSIGTLNTKVSTLEDNAITFVKTGEF